VSKEKEHTSIFELQPELLNAFQSVFMSRTDCYPLQLDKGSYISVKQPLTLSLIIAHLKGEVTIGVYALDTESRAHWLCFDVDDEDSFVVLKRLAQDLQAQGINSYLELSRRGGHLWLFTAPLPGKDIRRFGRQLLSGYSFSKIELYPKQDILTSGTGSLVRLPLGIHRKSGKRYPFITPDHQPLATTIREQIALVAHPVYVPSTFIDETLARIIEPPTLLPKPRTEKVKWASGSTLSERLKNAITVYDFVSRYVELDEHGKGLCPFHDDKHPSFQVNQTQNYWSCYAGCGGGSIVDFWMKWRQTKGQDSSFTATIKDLAQILF
jgi:hypothetical protein